MKGKMKCSKAVAKLFCNLSDELAFDIRQGKCSASSLVQLYKLMIKLELGVAFDRLGFYYLSGMLDGDTEIGLTHEKWIPRYSLALRHLRRAYELGVKGSAKDIACIYFQKAFKCTVTQNAKAPTKILNQMLMWTKLALPYEHGRRRADLYHYLGWYEFHYGDRKTATSLWKKAARNGGACAMFELGVVNGWGEGLPKNLKLARHWFDRCVACDPEYLPEVKKEMKKLGL